MVKSERSFLPKKINCDTTERVKTQLKLPIGMQHKSATQGCCPLLLSRDKKNFQRDSLNF